MPTIPKQQRLGHPHGKGGDPEFDTIPSAPSLLPKPADPKWSEPIQRLWESLGESGQASLYQPSDWAVAFLVCELLNIAMTTPNPNTGQLSASLVNVCMNALSRLLVTEYDRRKARVAIERETSNRDAQIAIMAEYRRCLEPEDGA